MPDGNISKYVLASFSGTDIIDVEDQGAIFDDAGNDVGCYQLAGTDDKIVKGCGDAYMTDGILEVDLSWKSSVIDLELSVFKESEDNATNVEVGLLDTFGETCPREHWYIKTEDDVKVVVVLMFFP